MQLFSLKKKKLSFSIVVNLFNASLDDALDHGNRSRADDQSLRGSRMAFVELLDTLAKIRFYSINDAQRPTQTKIIYQDHPNHQPR